MARRTLVIIPNDTVFDSRVSTVSLDFAGGEFIGVDDGSPVTFGIGNTCSWLIWFRPENLTATQRIVDIKTTDNDNRIEVNLMGAATNDPIRVRLYDSTGNIIKSYLYESVVALSTWIAIAFTWNGTTLQGYFNGVATAPTTLTTDDPGSRALTTMGIRVAGGFGVAESLTGYVHSITIWDAALTAGAVGSASVVAHNPASNIYGNKANLKHWFRMGLPVTGSMAGTTYVCDAVEADGVDLSTSTSGITDADIIANAPA